MALLVTKPGDLGTSFSLHRVYVRLLPLSVFKAMAFAQAAASQHCFVFFFFFFGLVWFALLFLRLSYIAKLLAREKSDFLEKVL